MDKTVENARHVRFLGMMHFCLSATIHAKVMLIRKAEQAGKKGSLRNQFTIDKRDQERDAENQGNERRVVICETPVRAEGRDDGRSTCFRIIDRHRIQPANVHSRRCPWLIIADGHCRWRSCKQTRKQTRLSSLLVRPHQHAAHITRQAATRTTQR